MPDSTVATWPVYRNPEDDPIRSQLEPKRVRRGSSD